MNFVNDILSKDTQGHLEVSYHIAADPMTSMSVNILCGLYICFDLTDTHARTQWIYVCGYANTQKIICTNSITQHASPIHVSIVSLIVVVVDVVVIVMGLLLEK